MKQNSKRGNFNPVSTADRPEPVCQNLPDPADLSYRNGSNRQNGFTLVEVLLALFACLISVMILFACMTVLKNGEDIHVETEIETRWYGG